MDKQQKELFDGFCRELATISGRGLDKAQEVMANYFRDSAYSIDTTIERLVKDRLKDSEIWRELAIKTLG